MREGVPRHVEQHTIEQPAFVGENMRKRGIVLRINEAYEHEPILPYTTEGECTNECGGCDDCGQKVGTQFVDIVASAVLTPTATIGTVAVTCQGTPVVTCTSTDDGATCILTVTQSVCVSVPVTYGVTLSDEEASITCSDGGCGCCN